uniref:Uncharacterized mitochondrial protein AtMg00810-like n=1 Tax=Tanacetum cinerariifolium TaxID=118510 RepID=A0A6L2LVV1_TANCI|nr:uncharacterized mitochondrial protein AtMg00810-like [Tanacetum cinerariifolium]
MYSVDLNNIVPKGGLTCLFTKATSDESKLWHRRLGHLNFKTMNKLVNGNLVRGLPSKIFENKQTCVACQKGKQHRASYKTKTENSISLTLHILHMDLFGLTLVKGLMKKMYYLVVTDDYSRVEAISTACYVKNRVLVVKPHNKTPYELFHGRIPMLSFMRPFGCPVTILNTIDQLGKFDGKADEGLFVGYTLNSKPVVTSTQSNGNAGTKNNNNTGQARKEKEPSKDYILLPLWTADLPFPHDPKSSQHAGFKPSNDVEKKVNEVPRQENECKDQKEKDSVNSTNRVNAVSLTVNAASNEVNVVSRKSRIKLLDDPNMPELEDISIFEDLSEDAFGAEADLNKLESTFQDFVVYQMDVKSAFLYEKIAEEVYVFQPLGFEDPDFPDKVYKVEKTLYGLHQASRAWYETLPTYLSDNEFHRGKIDKTLFIRRHTGDILLVQVYVDDIIFVSTKKELCTSFERLMHEKFQISSMRELVFFLGLQEKQKHDGIFISQDKYVAEILKKFGFFEVKTASTPIETQKPLLNDEDGEEIDVHIYGSMIGSLMYLTSSRANIMFTVCACARYQVNPKVSHLHAVKRIFRYLKGQPKLGLWYLKDSPFDLMEYTDSDYGGASLDRKSTTGVAVVNYFGFKINCYGYNFLDTKIFIDNNSTDKQRSVSLVMEILLEKELELMLVTQKKQLDGLPAHKEKYDVLFHTKKVFANMKRIGTGFSGKEATLFLTMVELTHHEDRLKHIELIKNCTMLQKKVLNLEDGLKRTKNTQQTKIDGLERRVKKLEKKQRSRTYKLNRLYKVGLTARVKSSSDDEALDKEDTSKQERIDEIDADEDIALVSTHDDVSTQDNIVQDEGIEDVVTVAIADILVSAADTIVTTAESIKKYVEVTQAPKRKGVTIQDPEETITTKTVSSQQPQVQDKSKGKAKLIKEPKMPKKRKHQIRAHKELAEKLQDEIDEEDRLARKRAQKEQEANDALINTTELVEESTKKDKAETTQESSSKREGDELEQERSKKQKVEDDKESKELKQCLEIILDDGNEVTIDATSLSSKANGNSQMYLTFSKLLKNFDREDLEVLWRLVKTRFEKTQPVDNMDSFILHTLKTMFEHHVEDNIHGLRLQPNAAPPQRTGAKYISFDSFRQIDDDLLKGYFADHHRDDLLDFANKTAALFIMEKVYTIISRLRDHIVSMEEKCATSATSKEEIFNPLNSLELKSLEEPIYLFGKFFKKPVECLTLVAVDCGVEAVVLVDRGVVTVVAARGWRWGGGGEGDSGGCGGVMEARLAREGEWCRGSVRSGGEEHIWVRRKRSLEKFSVGGGVVAGGWWLAGGWRWERMNDVFDFKTDSGEEISVVMNDIIEFECLDPRDEFDDDDYSSFMFVIYSKVFSFLHSAESEDTIFDPGISV